MATDKQVAYLKRLAADVGEPISEQELEEFSLLPVREASQKLTELEQRRDGQPAEAKAGLSQSEEPK